MVIYVMCFPTKLEAYHGCFIRVGTEEVAKDISHSSGPTQH